jgi:hypothetical protein
MRRAKRLVSITKAMAYKFSLKADDDLVDIYIAGVRGFGIAQAENHHAELVDRIRRLIPAQIVEFQGHTAFDTDSSV